jgi:AcrR family transcriptional regulator
MVNRPVDGTVPTISGENSPFNRSARRDAKHTAILSEAARLFNTRGSRGTTLRDIAESLGLTKSSLYHYVKTKEELIYQCYMATIDRHNNALDAVDHAGGTALQRLSAFYLQHIDDWLSAQREQGPHTAALLEIASLMDQHRDQVQGRYTAFFKRLRQTVRDGIAEGSVRDCEATSATRAFLGSLPAWSLSWLHRVPLDDVPEIGKQALDLVLHGLHANPTSYVPSTLVLEDTGSKQPVGFLSREEDSRQKQAAFTSAGTAFFNRKGFKSTSLDEISEYLNVSKGAFYYYIKNKEDLLYNCYAVTLDTTRVIHEIAAENPGNGMQKVEQVCRRMFIVENSDAGPLIRFSTITALPKSRRARVLQRIVESNHRFGNFIREGIADGSIRAVNDFVAENLISAAINASLNMELWRKIDDLDAAALDYFDIFFSGLVGSNSFDQ